MKVQGQASPLAIIFHILIIISLASHGATSNNNPSNLRRYQVCNGSRQCQSVKSLATRDLDVFLYSGWSIWGPCDRVHCSTSRYRSCRFPAICGTTELWEEAFCFRPNSHCEKIFYTMDQRMRSPSNENGIDLSNDPKDMLNSGSKNFIEHNIEGPEKDQGHGTRTRRKRRGRNHNRLAQGHGPMTPQISQQGSRSGWGTDWIEFGNLMSDPFQGIQSLFDHDPPIHHGSPEVIDQDYGLEEPDPKHDDETCGVPLISSGSTNDGSMSSSAWPSSRSRNMKNTTNDNHNIHLRRRMRTMNRKRLRILGGSESSRGRWPWQVAIINQYQEAFCGGTLIGPQWVLTAAHCVKRGIQVVLGEHNLHRRDGTEKKYRIDSAFIHPDFDLDTVDNDIALLALPQPVSTSGHGGLALACLPSPVEPLPPTDTLCTILGWGKQRYSHVFGSTVLQEAKVPIVSSAQCYSTYYNYHISSNMFCAGYPGGTVDSCAGDSGGPILCTSNNRWTVYGVTSFGDGCGQEGKFGIYAKVSNFVSWIRKVMAAYDTTNRLR